MIFLNNKGAMFGLDARIALAIFGALSIISGASLYSAIKKSRAEALRQYFESVIKATEQYYLDTGKIIPQIVASASVGQLYAADIAVNRETISYWNGPYLDFALDVPTSFAYFSDSLVKSYGVDSKLYMFLQKRTQWASSRSLSSEVCVVDDVDCAIWFALQASGGSARYDIMDSFNELDDLIDGGDGDRLGRVRHNTVSGVFVLMYQGILAKKYI